MTEEDLIKAIEVAEEAVAGFADDGSFEQLLAMAVLELRDQLIGRNATWNGRPVIVGASVGGLTLVTQWVRDDLIKYGDGHE